MTPSPRRALKPSAVNLSHFGMRGLTLIPLTLVEERERRGGGGKGGREGRRGREGREEGEEREGRGRWEEGEGRREGWRRKERRRWVKRMVRSKDTEA